MERDKTEFEAKKAEFIENFNEKYYSQINLNWEFDLIIAFNKVDFDYEVYSISPENVLFIDTQSEYIITRSPNHSMGLENFDFSELNKEIFEILVTFNPEKLRKYINNNINNFYKFIMSFSDCENIIKDFKDLSELEDIDEIVMFLTMKNSKFNYYLFNNLYLWYYRNTRISSWEDNYLLNEVKNIKYEDIYQEVDDEFFWTDDFLSIVFKSQNSA